MRGERITTAACLVAVILLLSLPAPARAQGITDLVAGKKATGAAGKTSLDPVTMSDDRVDLRLSANVIPSAMGRKRGEGAVGLSANLDLDFVCGQFDLKGTFRNLLGKEMREEFLKEVLSTIESEITGSAMELLCQAQPTLCTLLQNHNIAANLKLGYHYDRCAEIERAVGNARRAVAAGAIEDCLRRKRAAGVPLAEAIDACRKAERVRGFQGESLVEFDLGKELGRLVRLSEGSKKLLEKLSEETRYSAARASSKPNANLFVERLDEIRTGYLERWKEALRRARAGAPLTGEDLSALAPTGFPGVSPREVERLLLLPPHEGEAVVESLASAIAMAEMTREIHEIERALEAVAGAPAIEEPQRKLLEARLLRLRKERARFEEVYHDIEEYRRAYLAATGLARSEMETRIAREREKASMGPAKSGLYAATRAWGSRGPAPAPGIESSTSTSRTASGDCGACGVEYGVGTLQGPK